MTMDVIICTYNRPFKVMELVLQLQNCNPCPSNIIVVDSSDSLNQELQAKEGVLYVRSNHKNQPYQRFLGYKKSTSEYLLFLDDDMEIIENTVFSILSSFLLNHSLAGIALNFRDKHSDTTLAAVPKSNLFSFSKNLRKFKNWFTGYPELKIGELGLCGNRGKQPSQVGPTEFLSGGAFIAKREALFQNFNFQLFDLFEEKMGMGEDALIGYSLTKSGNLFFLPDVYFLHNDQKDSSYSLNIEDYSKRVIYSRLYLSLEKRRMDNQNLAVAYIHFHWYSFWRISGQILNYLLKPSLKRKQVILGTLKGWRKAFTLNYKIKFERNDYWIQESEALIN